MGLFFSFKLQTRFLLKGIEFCLKLFAIVRMMILNHTLNGRQESANLTRVTLFLVYLHVVIKRVAFFTLCNRMMWVEFCLDAGNPMLPRRFSGSFLGRQVLDTISPPTVFPRIGLFRFNVTCPCICDWLFNRSFFFFLSLQYKHRFHQTHKWTFSL